MTTARTALIAAGALAAAVALAAPASAQMYGLGTGKQGFFTYSAGAAIAKVAADNGMNLRLQPYGGTSAYVPGVNAGEIEFGLANELGDALRRHRHGHLQGQAAEKLAGDRGPHPALFGILRAQGFPDQDHRRPQGQAGAQRLCQPDACSTY